MLTRLTISNFKRFDQVDIELGNPVVFIGPNNSGKTTALQALALWHIGVRKWLERRQGSAPPESRPGVTINRRDLVTIPAPSAKMLWRHLHTAESTRIDGKQQSKNVLIEICAEGVSNGASWRCGMEFYYANEESFYCRPQRSGDPSGSRMTVPDDVGEVTIGYLPPMSGLASSELKLEPGAIQVRLGEGRTAEVLRNLCYQLTEARDGDAKWARLTERIKSFFGVTLERPEYISERGEVSLSYREPQGTTLDISAAGRGLQQTLLLLAHLGNSTPGAVLLLDEPDAHLEILRQRQMYQTLTDAARENNAQVIAASHSEVVLNEAADRDVVIAFLGKPHRIDDRGSQLLKSLKEIGFDQYYQAEQTGWVLYIEGSTDLAILQAIARRLNHPAQSWLERPFVHYVLNQPAQARHHFHGLQEAKGDLLGLAIFDAIDEKLRDALGLRERRWSRREIENYIVNEASLVAWAAVEAERQAGALFQKSWVNAMTQSIAEVSQALRTLGKDPWDSATKVTDQLLDPLFARFFAKLNLPNIFRKTDYHGLVEHLPLDQFDPELSRMLDELVEVAASARPLQ